MSKIDDVRDMDLEDVLAKDPEFSAWLKEFNPEWESEYSGNIKALYLAWCDGYMAALHGAMGTWLS